MKIVIQRFYLSALLFIPFFSEARQVDFAIASDVMIYAGDGIGDSQDLELRVAALKAPNEAPAEVSTAYEKARKALQGLLDSASQGQEMSWLAPQELSGSLRQITEYQAQRSRDASFLLEYLTLRYLSRHYIGYVDSVPSDNESIASRSEADLVKELDAVFGADLDNKSQSSWSLVRKAALDVDSSMGGWMSISGRPLTPLPFYRSTRYLIGRM